MRTFMRIFLSTVFAFFLCAASCTKNDRMSQNAAANLNEIGSDYCNDLVQACPKLARLAYAHPPKPSGDHGYFIYPELLSYLIDSIKTERMYFNMLDEFCPGVTREQLICAIGEPGTSGILVEDMHGDGHLSGDGYSFSWDPSLGNESFKYWKEPFYIPVLFYGDDGTLKYVIHNGVQP